MANTAADMESTICQLQTKIYELDAKVAKLYEITEKQSAICSELANENHTRNQAIDGMWSLVECLKKEHASKLEHANRINLCYMEERDAILNEQDVLRHEGRILEAKFRKIKRALADAGIDYPHA